MTEHQVGERSSDGMVWTGTAWTLPCPIDGTPMVGRTGQGHLCCEACGWDAVTQTGVI